MLSEIIEKFSKLSANIKNHERDRYSGTYQWRNKSKSWLFDIELEDECSWQLSLPSLTPDYQLYIDESDLDALVNKKIDPLGAINSGKLEVGFNNLSEKDENKSHVQRFLNVIFNKGTIDEDIKTLLEKFSPKADDVPSCPITYSNEEVERFIKTGSPCLLKKSACTQWGLYQMDEQEILNKINKDHEVNLLMGEHKPDEGESAEYRTSTLRQYVTSLLNGKAVNLSYMAANSVPEALYDHFEYPPYFDRSAFNIPRWWIGPQNTGLGLHRDLVDNFLYQLKGTKTVYIFSPSESEYLYPVVFGGNPFYEPSSVNLFSPDLKRHPNFSKAKGIHVELSPGDMLYLPAGWWHCIKNVDISWSVNFFAVNQRPAVLSNIKN